MRTPTLGEDTEHVLRSELGLDDAAHRGTSRRQGDLMKHRDPLKHELVPTHDQN